MPNTTKVSFFVQDDVPCGMKASYNKQDFIGQNIAATTDTFYCAFDFIIHSFLLLTLL